MSLAVIDASVLVAFYSTDDLRRPSTTARLTGGDALFAPAHLDAEVLSALRRLARENQRVAETVPAAVRHLAGLPVRRMPLVPLLERMWQLRDSITSYDAAYVALAEVLGATLVTCDAKLAAAGGTQCAFDVIS